MSQQNTTQTPTLSLAVIPDDAVDQLSSKLTLSKTIQDLLGNSEAIAAFGEAIATPTINKFCGLDINTLDDEKLTIWDKHFNDTLARINTGYDKQQSERMPLTGKFRDIITLFTSKEKRLEAIKVRIQVCRESIAKRKHGLASQVAILAKKNADRATEAVTYKGDLRKHLILNTTAAASGLINKMTRDFLDLTLETFDLFSNNIISFSTSVSNEAFHAMYLSHKYKWVHYNPSEEVTPSFTIEEKAALESECNTLYSTAIRQKIDELVAQLPMKKLSLSQGVLMTEADKERVISSSTDFIDRIATSQTQQSDFEMAVERVAAADISSVVLPSQAKGTSIKKIIDPKNPAQWSLLIALYCEQVLANLTEEEINKKFGFIAKHYTNVGNAGMGWPVGIDTKDDFKTSTRSSKK